jgi:protein O-mannosyl-transferase
MPSGDEIDSNSILKPTHLRRIFWLLCVLIWLPSVHPNIVNIDTPWLVCNNPILSSAQFDVFSMIWTDLSFATRNILGAEYLPIRDISVWLDFLIFGDFWTGHHLSNLVFYLIGCGLFYKILSLLIGNSNRAFLGALFFALHPTHIESLSWLASRKDVLSLCFFMWAILLHLQKKNILIISIVCLLAYWSKNTALSLGPILVCISLFIHKESPFKIKWWLQWIPVSMVLVFGLGLSLHVGGMMQMFAPERADLFIEVYSITAQVSTQYLGMLLWPDSLALFYVEPHPVSILSVPVLVGTALMVLCLLYPILRYRKEPLLALGFAWIALSLLPVSQIIPIQNLMSDRYLLLPSAGLAIILASHWPKRLKIAPPFYILGLAVMTLWQLPNWHSSEALWLNTTEQQPNDPRGWAALAGVYQSEGRLEEAKGTVLVGLTHKDSPVLHQSLGLIYMARNEYPKAKKELIHAWAQDKQLRKSGNNLATLYQREGDLTQAAFIAEELTGFHPFYAMGWNTRGAIALDMGNYAEAKSSLTTALELDPYMVSSLVNLGNVAYQEQDFSTAQLYWEKALAIEPTHEHAKRGLEHLLLLEAEQ